MSIARLSGYARLGAYISSQLCLSSLEKEHEAERNMYERNSGRNERERKRGNVSVKRHKFMDEQFYLVSGKPRALVAARAKAIYVHTRVYSPIFHIPTRLRTSSCTLARICATNGVQKSREARVDAATGSVNYRYTIDIALLRCCLCTLSLSLSTPFLRQPVRPETTTRKKRNIR